MSTLRSPINWLGGKARIAERIIATLPPAATYDVFCDVFFGSGVVTFAKPKYNHLEVINDRNERLVNFWMQVRDQAKRLQWELDTLPYAETMFKQFRQSLENETLDPLEEAVQWFYVTRSTIAGHIDSKKGWAYLAPHSRTVKDMPSKAVSYHNAVSLLESLNERLQGVQIHAWDFERLIKKFESPRTLFYCDPPYFGAENYYTVDNTPAFTIEDHARLARLLNATPAKVALSYYECPELDMYYPGWHRLTWTTHKMSSRLNSEQQTAREVLLMNYQPAAQSLWDDIEVKETDSEGVA